MGGSGIGASAGAAKKAATSSDGIGANPLVELEMEAQEAMVQKFEDEEEDQVENAAV